MPSKAARISFTPAGTLCCAGAWTLDHLADLERQIDSLPETSAGRITCDVGAIDAMDTGGAWLLRRTLNQFQQRGCEVTLNALSPEFVALMQTVARSWSRTDELQPTPPPNLSSGSDAWHGSASTNFRNALDVHWRNRRCFFFAARARASVSAGACYFPTCRSMA